MIHVGAFVIFKVVGLHLKRAIALDYTRRKSHRRRFPVRKQTTSRLPVNFMKMLFCSCLLALVCAASVAAQQPARYSFDNFDAHSGVRIATMPTTDVLPKQTATAKDVAPKNRRNAKEKFAPRPKPVSYTTARAAAGKSAGALAGFTTGDSKVDSYITESGARHGVDPALLYAIMHQESSFKPRAVSNKGAAGLMQIMPATATRLGVRDRFDPRQSVEGGAKYMSILLKMFGGDERLALAGYNAGEGAVLRYGRRVPPYRETQDYVRRIMRRYELMRDPVARRAAPPVALIEIAEATAALPPPPPSYEPEVFAVRLADGKLRLVSQ